MGRLIPTHTRQSGENVRRRDEIDQKFQYLSWLDLVQTSDMPIAEEVVMFLTYMGSLD
jgi:hypothetical protein